MAGASVTVSAMPFLLWTLGASAAWRYLCDPRNPGRKCCCVSDTAPMGDLVPPDPPLAGAQVALRPFRVSDAVAISESSRDPDILRFTMMPEAMTEDQARQWV